VLVILGDDPPANASDTAPAAADHAASLSANDPGGL
jgi:hypothetical protein